jgi:hypothetical protein
MTADAPAEDTPRCSAKGCVLEARWQLLWNNPKIHTPDRRKTWLACEDHRSSLSDFLGARGFLRELEPMGSAPLPQQPTNPPTG